MGIWQDEAACGLQSGGCALAEGGSEGVHGFLKKRAVGRHVVAVFCLLVEEIAELAIGFRFSGAKDTVDIKNLLRVGEAEADITVGKDIDEEVGVQGIDRFARCGIRARIGASLALATKAKNHTRLDNGIVRMRRDAGVEAEGSGFESGLVGFDVFQEFETEVVEREFGEGDAVAEVFDIKHLVLEAEELLIAIAEVVGDDVFDLLVLENIVLEGRGEVHERHASFDAVFEVDVFVEVFGGPEIHEVNGGIHAANAVDAAEALDDADRIPVDVVIDEVVAILKVLAFADAIRGDEKVDLALLRHGGHLFAFLRAGRKVGQNLVIGRIAEGRAGVSTTTNQSSVDAKFGSCPVQERVVEVGSGVGESGEDKNLFVRLAKRVGGGFLDFGGNEFF